VTAAIRAVCFDLDGTLLRDDHVDGVVRRVAAELAERWGGFDADALAAANERSWMDYWPEVGEAWLRGEIEPDALPTEVWRRALHEMGVTDASAAAHAFALHTAFEGAAFSLYDEAMEVLEVLQERGIRIALITNGPSGLQRGKLVETGIAEAFDIVVVWGEHSVSKPDAAIFDVALAGLGVSAAEALHIGDNIVADIDGALGAWLTAVWIDRGGDGPRPPWATADAPWEGTRPHVVTNLRELYGIVGVDGATEARHPAP